MRLLERHRVIESVMYAPGRGFLPKQVVLCSMRYNNWIWVSSSVWENTGLSSVVVIERVTESRKANRVVRS